MEALIERILLPAPLHRIRRTIVHAHPLGCLCKTEQSLRIQRSAFKNERELGERSLRLVLFTQYLAKKQSIPDKLRFYLEQLSRCRGSVRLMAGIDTGSNQTFERFSKGRFYFNCFMELFDGLLKMSGMSISIAGLIGGERAFNV